MIDYIKCNDYLVPALRLEDEEYPPLGKYGMLRETYLREHHRGTYTSMILTGRLQKHLAEIDQTAQERVDHMMAEMTQREGVTEALKAADPMCWVQLMNGIKASAEEVVLQELIYV